jgi:hypothetical protein
MAVINEQGPREKMKQNNLLCEEAEKTDFY